MQQNVKSSMVRSFRRAYGVILQVQMEKRFSLDDAYKSPNSTEKNAQELLKLMKSDLLNNYDKIHSAGDFNYPSVTWDGERSNSKDNEFVECFKDVFLTQTVKKKKKKKKKWE